MPSPRTAAGKALRNERRSRAERKELSIAVESATFRIIGFPVGECQNLRWRAGARRCLFQPFHHVEVRKGAEVGIGVGLAVGAEAYNRKVFNTRRIRRRD